MSQADEVRIATLDDAELLGEVFCDAFTDDPVFNWLIPPDTPEREARTRAFFTAISRVYLRLGKPCFLSGDGAGAALWSAPGTWALPMDDMSDEVALLIAAFGERIDTSVELQLQVEGLHPVDPPHFYLAYLGTRRASQGQGHGGQLLRAVLNGADADGIPAYLESSNARNVPLYERHGFKVVEEFQALNDGPTIYRMWREATS